MKEFYVYGIGLSAVGMSTWLKGAAILRGDKHYDKTELPNFTPLLLRPEDSERSTALIKLALHVAEHATEHSTLSPENFCTVFASSAGDSAIIDKLCAALSMPERSISSTEFHNSAHNAPGAYWSIVTGCQLPSTSLGAGSGSFAGGLLEAVGLSAVRQRPTLFVSYDLPPPYALQPVIPIEEAFGCALVLGSNAHEHCLAKIRLELNTAVETTLNDGALESLRLSNPAARALPLLKTIACKQTQTVVLPYLDDLNLTVTCAPC